MIIGVGAVITNKQSQILLVKRRNDPERLTWSIPGGKMEGFESPNQTILREIREELGVDSIINNYLGSHHYEIINPPYKGISILFSVSICGVHKNLELSENLEIKWFGLEKIPFNISVVVRHALKLLRTSKESSNFLDSCELYDSVLIQPYYPEIHKLGYSRHHGFAILSNILRKNNFSLLMLNCSSPSNFLHFCNHLKSTSALVAGIHFDEDELFEWSLRCCNFIRVTLPDIFIIGCGDISAYKSNWLLKNRWVDFVIGNSKITDYRVLELKLNKILSNRQHIFT